jgi:hypothetical protein
VIVLGAIIGVLWLLTVALVWLLCRASAIGDARER